MLGIITNGMTRIEIRLALQWDPERHAYAGPLKSEQNAPDQDGTPIIVVTPSALLKAMALMVAQGEDITEAFDPDLWLNFLGKDGVSRDIEPTSK